MTPLDSEIVAHHLRLVGVVATTLPSQPGVLVADSRAGDWRAVAQAATARGRPIVVLGVAATRALLDDVAVEARAATSSVAYSVGGRHSAWGRLRSLHPASILTVQAGEGVVTDADDQALWQWLRRDRGGLLLVGTDLANDLVRLRQGDPAAANNRPTEVQWGIAGERPNYLFEAQLEQDRPHARMADWWVWTLRDALIRHAGIEAESVLPFGAKGAVIVTGDDDQAPLEDYRAQALKLGGLPVTYFLHPLAKLDAAALADLSQGRSLDWQLHPDALDSPADYANLLRRQSEWFAQLTGRRARLVRNHGFLNDGYWGHAASWNDLDIDGSSNLPGVDGRIINGSLLPARLALDGKLTRHWSILTAFGDGVFFVYDWSAAHAHEAVIAFARRIAESEVPGIVVFNLHPANHEKAGPMHAAIHVLVRELGFAAMTFGAALDWFIARDQGREADVSREMIAPYTDALSGMPAPGGSHAAVNPLVALEATPRELQPARGLVRRVLAAGRRVIR
jgi:hypothetical protein